MCCHGTSPFDKHRFVTVEKFPLQSLHRSFSLNHSYNRLATNQFSSLYSFSSSLFLLSMPMLSEYHLSVDLFLSFNRPQFDLCLCFSFSFIQSSSCSHFLLFSYFVSYSKCTLYLMRKSTKFRCVYLMLLLTQSLLVASFPPLCNQLKCKAFSKRR